jgi:hypothetical protein
MEIAGSLDLQLSAFSDQQVVFVALSPQKCHGVADSWVDKDFGSTRIEHG